MVGGEERVVEHQVWSPIRQGIRRKEEMTPVGLSASEHERDGDGTHVGKDPWQGASQEERKGREV